VELAHDYVMSVGLGSFFQMISELNVPEAMG
jgi:hypothetical protein